MKFSISIENVNPDLDNSPQKRGLAVWLAWKFHSRLNMSIWDWSLKNFKLGAKHWKISLLGASFRGAPSTVRNFMTSSGCSMEGALPKKRKLYQPYWGSTILKLIWGRNLLYFPGFEDLQPYETCKFRICSESVSGVFPDLFRISLWKCLTVLGAPPTLGGEDTTT